MPVGYITDIRLCAVLESLTSNERRGVTWRAIPGEAPKQSDLLLAFVEGVPDAPGAAALTDDAAEEDFSEEEAKTSPSGNSESIATYQKRTQRLIDAVKAKIGADFRHTPVRLLVLRKLDRANRKVAYSGAPTVGELYDAATDWVQGERNVPPRLLLPVVVKGGKKPRPISPPHVAPLGLIAFTKQVFLRNGQRPAGKKKEQVGLSAAEAIALFLDTIRIRNRTGLRPLHRALRLVIARRVSLVAASSHIHHTPESWERRDQSRKKLDAREGLRTLTVLGILLHKLGRTKENYMNDAAFKLGQLLAAADVVHAGYCADVRGGDIPPSLLGNQVFTTAQTAPVKALAILCRRWKPYGGWAEMALRAIDPKTQLRRDETLRQSKDRRDVHRGWDISKALSVVRRVRPLIDELRQALDGCRVDDAFRAELLLGYVAGLPAPHKNDHVDDEQAKQTNPQEDQ
jgi:hypothetical protein